MASSLNLLKAARKWHRNVSTILFAFFFFIAVTAVLLSWENLFASKIFTTTNKQKTAKKQSNGYQSILYRRLQQLV